MNRLDAATVDQKFQFRVIPEGGKQEQSISLSFAASTTPFKEGKHIISLATIRVKVTVGRKETTFVLRPEDVRDVAKNILGCCWDILRASRAVNRMRRNLKLAA